MAKWEWKDIWYDGREFDTDREEEHALKMSYLDRLVSLECAVMGIEPTLNSGHIFFINEDDVQWDFEDVLKKAMDFNDTAEEIDKRFTIGEICDLWYALYGENMREEYSRFVDELKQRIA